MPAASSIRISAVPVDTTVPPGAATAATGAAATGSSTQRGMTRARIIATNNSSRLKGKATINGNITIVGPASVMRLKSATICSGSLPPFGACTQTR